MGFVGSLLAVLLGIGGFARAYFTQYYLRPPGDDGVQAMRGCIAVTASLMVIVVTSAVLGTSLPLSFALIGLDIAHAGPTIQVIMDIGGVVITCAIARLVLRAKVEGDDAEQVDASRVASGKELESVRPRSPVE